MRLTRLERAAFDSKSKHRSFPESGPCEFDNGGQQLGNYWKGSDLKVKGVSLTNGTATIQITRRLSIAGICDEPRITEQIEATAKQLPTVKTIRVFVNGTPLKEAIR